MSVHDFTISRDTAEALVELIENEADDPCSYRISYLDILYADLREKFGMKAQPLPLPSRLP